MLAIMEEPKLFDYNSHHQNSSTLTLTLDMTEGRIEIVQLLVKLSNDFSIDLNPRDNKGWTALHLACRNRRTEIVFAITCCNSDMPMRD